MAGNLVISTINGGPIGAKNAIINGNFGINQRGVSGTVTLSAGAYGHDRWKAGASGCTYTFATSENVTTLTISSGSLIQVIEGLNLNSGTYTLSWAGTSQGKIGAGSYAGSGVTGTATGGTNLNIEFGTGTVSLVQLEKGSVATPFEFRPYGTELALCQRYCQVLSPQSSHGRSIYAFGTGGNTTTVLAFYYPVVTMRAVPSVSYLNVGVDDTNGPVAVSALSIGGSSTNAVINLTATASGLTQFRPYMLEANNTVSSYIQLSSEL